MKLIVLFALCLSLVSSNQVILEEVECSKFKTGMFEHFVDGKSTGTIIKRDVEFQVEVNDEMKIQTKDKVTWLNDCSFKLTMIGGGANDPDLIIEIIETGEDYYIYNVWSESNPKKVFQNKMIRIDNGSN